MMTTDANFNTGIIPNTQYYIQYLADEALTEYIISCFRERIMRSVCNISIWPKTNQLTKAGTNATPHGFWAKWMQMNLYVLYQNFTKGRVMCRRLGTKFTQTDEGGQHVIRAMNLNCAAIFLLKTGKIGKKNIQAQNGAFTTVCQPPAKCTDG